MFAKATNDDFPKHGRQLAIGVGNQAQIQIKNKYGPNALPDHSRISNFKGKGH